MTVMILGGEDDEHAVHMLGHLRAGGHDVELLDARDFPARLRIAYDPKRARRARIVSEIELFQGLTEDERRRVAAGMKPAPFSRGEAVMRQGTLGEWLYIITRGTGEVRIYEDAEHYITVAKVKAGDFLGEMSLLTGELRTATVIALEEMDCYRLDGETFRDLITARPQLAEYIAEVLARRRTELQSVREGLSDHHRQDEMRQTQHDILRRIYQFFSLGSASASD